MTCHIANRHILTAALCLGTVSLAFAQDGKGGKDTSGAKNDSVDYWINELRNGDLNAKVAALRNLPLQEIAAAARDNFKRLFAPREV